jgi:type IX secretion system PorP/SprF family membrane protein
MPNFACVISRIVLLFIILSGWQKVVQAQDVYFSQFYLNPVYMNSAYTGTMKVPRVGVQYRNQWPALENAYTTYFASFDTYLPKISSGIGLLLFNDVQGNGAYTESSFRFSYSKEIRLNPDWTMYGSISAGAQLNTLNFNRLIFSDGIDYDLGQVGPSVEVPPDNNNRIFPDFATGMLFYNGQYFFGLAADHLSQPNQSVYSEYPNKIPLKITGHFEFNFPFHLFGHYRKFCKLNPNVVIQAQGVERNITYGIYANRKGFSVGLWNRLTTAKSSDVIIMAGYLNKQLKTAISYDVNLTGVGLKSHGAVEVSVSYLLKDPGRKSIFPFYEIPGEWDVR